MKNDYVNDNTKSSQPERDRIGVVVEALCLPVVFTAVVVMVVSSSDNIPMYIQILCGMLGGYTFDALFTYTRSLISAIKKGEKRGL